jgi:hypothetical protein
VDRIRLAVTRQAEIASPCGIGFAAMSAAIIGLVGVVVGAIVGGVANWLVQNSQANRQTASSVRAIARLTYDDFLHYQSTLVRALARDHDWWDRTEALHRQTSVEDRKQLLGALDDEPSQDVAAAQGWMDYLLSRSNSVARPTDIDLTVMRDTFCRLDRGRYQLSGSVSGRRYTSFKDGAVLESLDHPATLEDLGISESQCEARRAIHYGRPQPDVRASELSVHDPLDD